MKTEDILRKQLTSRLRRLRDRALALNAEIQLVERLLADAEQGSFHSSLKLRKNSVHRLNAQARVRKHLGETEVSVRAQHLYTQLLRDDPALKSSTFRSHLKRMVDAGIIKQEGTRGYYQLVERPIAKPEGKETSRPWKLRVPHSRFF